MGGRGTTGKTKLFTNIDADRNKPFREAQAKEIAESKRRPARTSKLSDLGISGAKIAATKRVESSFLSPPGLSSLSGSDVGTRKQRLDLLMGELGSAARKAKSPTQTLRFSVTTAHDKWETRRYDFSARVVNAKGEQRIAIGLTRSKSLRGVF